MGHMDCVGQMELGRIMDMQLQSRATTQSAIGSTPTVNQRKLALYSVCCSSDSQDDSHVIGAIRLPYESDRYVSLSRPAHRHQVLRLLLTREDQSAAYLRILKFADRNACQSQGGGLQEHPLDGAANLQWQVM